MRSTTETRLTLSGRDGLTLDRLAELYGSMEGKLLGMHWLGLD
jgi:hypothetical protein